jgi:hypothetical protein
MLSEILLMKIQLFILTQQEFFKFEDRNEIVVLREEKLSLIHMDELGDTEVEHFLEKILQK